MTEASDGASPRCACCGEPFRVHDLAICGICRRPFHLALRIDIPAPDCGQVWIDEELGGIRFGCNTCLNEHDGAGRKDG